MYFQKCNATCFLFFIPSAVRNSRLSPGQVQHGLQDVGSVFGTGFTEQSAVRLMGAIIKGKRS